MAGSRYSVTYERGDVPGQWIASVDDLQGCHTFGRGLRQTRRRIREALGLVIGSAAARRAVLEEHLPLPRPLASELDDIAALQRRVVELEHARTELSARRQRLARALVRRRWSLRDVSHLVGLTFQRVGQLLDR
jgi:predicted RNase H-like HicB family nuclease